jgi:hypothetical protein
MSVDEAVARRTGSPAGTRADHPVVSWRSRTSADENLRTANEHDACVERPLHHEVVSTGHTQPGAHGAFTPFDFANNLGGLTNHLRLDVRALVGKVDQDHVAESKHLDVHLNRHRGASLDANALAVVLEHVSLVGRVDEELASRIEIGRVHQDLARAGGCEFLEGGVDRLRVAIVTVDARRAQQAADDVGLGTARDDGDDYGFVRVHTRQPTLEAAAAARRSPLVLFQQNV